MFSQSGNNVPGSIGGTVVDVEHLIAQAFCLANAVDPGGEFGEGLRLVV
jgi:hypothetical protein